MKVNEMEEIWNGFLILDNKNSLYQTVSSLVIRVNFLYQRPDHLLTLLFEQITKYFLRSSLLYPLLAWCADNLVHPVASSSHRVECKVGWTLVDAAHYSQAWVAITVDELLTGEWVRKHSHIITLRQTIRHYLDLKIWSRLSIIFTKQHTKQWIPPSQLVITLFASGTRS